MIVQAPKSARIPASVRRDSGGQRAHRSRRRAKELWWAAAFLTPALIAIATLRIAPTVSAAVSSLYKGFPGGVLPAEFSGLANYSELVGNDMFRDTVLRTIVFNVIINPVQVALALVISVLLTRRILAPNVWRMLVFVPASATRSGPGSAA